MEDVYIWTLPRAGVSVALSMDSVSCATAVANVFESVLIGKESPGSCGRQDQILLVMLRTVTDSEWATAEALAAEGRQLCCHKAQASGCIDLDLYRMIDGNQLIPDEFITSVRCPIS